VPSISLLPSASKTIGIPSTPVYVVNQKYVSVVNATEPQKEP